MWVSDICLNLWVCVTLIRLVSYMRVGLFFWSMIIVGNILSGARLEGRCPGGTAVVL